MEVRRLMEDRPAQVGAATGAPVSLPEVVALLRGLDRDQRRAVTHAEGPLLVVAGPGTGKTEVLTRRIAWLVATKRARPAEILALTFTERAAAEMSARVDLLVPYGHAEAAIHTFHAFGDGLIRESAHELGLPMAPRLIDRAEAVALLKEHLFELGLDRYRPLADPTRFLATIVDRCTRAKDEGLTPADLMHHSELMAARARAAALADSAGIEDAAALADAAAGERELAIAYDRYQALLVERGLIDFADQVSLAARLLAERPAIRAELQRRYRYLLVDEFQDTDPVQLRLLSLLAGRKKNVTVVGDDDQSIYTFRGAAVGNIMGFSDTFPGTQRVVLRRNHRSHAPILVAAQRLVRHNDPHRLEAREGLDKTLVAVRRKRGPEKVRLRAFDSAASEADALAALIAERIRGGQRPRDFAILARTHADTAPVVQSLGHLAVPVRSVGPVGLYQRPHIRECLSFLRCAIAPDSTIDLYGMATGAPYRLGGEPLTLIVELARRRHRSLWSVITELEDQPRLLRLPEATNRGLACLRADLRTAMEMAHLRPAAEVLYGHLDRSGRLREMIQAAGSGDDAPLRDLARLFDVLRARASLLEDDRLSTVVPHLQSLVEAGDDLLPPDGDAHADEVSVLTVHRAKGLEFPVVFLIGLVDGRFPLRGRADRLALPAEVVARALVDEAPHAEERRLCFVAMTRARDELHLSWSRRTGTGRTRRPSPFIAEALDIPFERVLAGAAAVTETATDRIDRVAHPAMPAGGIGSPAGTPVTGPSTLSFSQIDDYLTCPLRYRLRHVVGVPTPAHHALVLGNALHQAAAAFHTAQARGRLMEETELLAVFDAHWSAEGFLSRQHEEARHAAGQEALRRFRRDATAPGASVPVAVERTFSVEVGSDVLRGRFDRVDEGSGGTVITDYKSSDVRDPRKAAERARDSLQLQVYALAHQAETGALPAAVQLHFLESGLVGRAVPDPARLAKARQRIASASDGIRNGRFEPTPDRIACSYCPYRQVCHASAA